MHLGSKEPDNFQARGSRCGGGVPKGSTQIMALDEA